MANVQKKPSHILTKLISNVKHGVCFLVSLILTDCAFAADFMALDKFSGTISR